MITAVKHKLQQAIVPTDTNEGIPSLLQVSGVVMLLALAFGLFILAFVHGSVIERNAGTEYAAVIAAVLIDQTNNERVNEGLSNLEPSALLTASAKLKAEDMANNSYFAHTSPAGLSPWHWFKQVGYQFSFAGENLAVNFRDSGSVTRAWMNSPSHRENIVNKNYEQIGIATATGKYKGKTTTFVAQHFATPYQSPGTTSQIDQETVERLREILGRQVSVTEGHQALTEANNFLAAVNEVGSVDKILVQPDRLYSSIFLGLLILVLGVSANAYLRSDSRAKQKQILFHATIISIVLVALGLATLQLMATETIASSALLIG